MVVVLLRYFDKWFLIVCLVFWLVVFFCLVGPILVCLSGDQSPSVINSPSHINYDSTTMHRIRSTKERNKDTNKSIKY